MDGLLDYGAGIYAFNAAYVRPSLAAIHLIVDNGRAALIDSGTSASVPRVEETLATLGLGAGDVDYLILTHVHLDHAAGAGILMRRLPHARLVVHPRGARHRADPRGLWAAVSAVYGPERTAPFTASSNPFRPSASSPRQTARASRSGDASRCR